MIAFANAKINIGLNITEKRPDGYHEIETVFYPVKLYDVIEITDAPATHFVLKGIPIPGKPEDNLCLKAFGLLAAAYDLPPQQITLLKHIPIGAGLGGGSADAAFVLKLVNAKFKLNLPPEVLISYARQLGADCPFFIENKPVFATGIGDVMTPVNLDLSPYFLVLIKPDIHVATAKAYAQLTPVKTRRSVKDLISSPLYGWKQAITNDFDHAGADNEDEITRIKEELYHHGAIFSLLSGSGSTVYAVFLKEIRLPEMEKKYNVFYNV